jgi:hypothetical protein
MSQKCHPGWAGAGLGLGSGWARAGLGLGWGSAGAGLGLGWGWGWARAGAGGAGIRDHTYAAQSEPGRWFHGHHRPTLWGGRGRSRSSPGLR